MTGFKDFIPFSRPDIGQEEIDEVIECLRSGWLTTGPRTKKFEDNFSVYIGVDFALAVNSATSGLHLALEAVGIKRGDKVVVPINTFTATAEVVRYFDADPIFCDIDPETFNIDVDEFKKILISHPERNMIRAVMPVHIAGQACDMETILAIARENNIRVIEDAAHSFPATYNGKKIGSIGDITVFSFYASKTLCTGEGGMVTTNNREFADRIQIMRQHGIDRIAWDRYHSDRPSWFYSVIAPGFKYNMNDLSGSLGIHQLAKADAFLERRLAIASQYNEKLKNINNLSLPVVRNKSDIHSYHLYIIKVDKRDEFIEKMASYGVGTSVHFIPLYMHPYWRERYALEEGNFPAAQENFQKIVSLPIYSSLSDDQVDYIVKTVKIVLNELDG